MKHIFCYFVNILDKTVHVLIRVFLYRKHLLCQGYMHQTGTVNGMKEHKRMITVHCYCCMCPFKRRIFKYAAWWRPFNFVSSIYDYPQLLGRCP